MSLVTSPSRPAFRATSSAADCIPAVAAIAATPASHHRGWMAAWRIRITRTLLALFAASLLVTRSAWADDAPMAAAGLMCAGLLLTGVAAAGRLWCSLYIAGRKNRALVTEGPYSMCRNPLYFFSLLGAIGAVMATGMLTVTLGLAALFMLFYRPVISAEEIRLAGLFGEEFRNYCSQVPRFLPRRRLFRHGESLQVNPRVFLDHALCVIWFPAAAGLLVLLHATELSLHLPVWFRLI